ncbi:MAG: outer membrane protein transport protein [Planctomycetaceae bacterium]|nr:outer membrane protein transport protein [Planctomycetaceae bacterium]
MCHQLRLGLLLAICLFVAAPLHAQVGHILDAVGAVNQSMGGAGTGLPLDSIGALHWNPASIGALPQSEVAFSFMGFSPTSRLSSTVQADAFGLGTPPSTLQGSTDSDVDVSPIPSLGLVFRDTGSPWTFGLGGFGIGGFGVDYPGGPNNPIVSPQPADGGMGFGAVYSNFQLMQFCPTVAYTFPSGLSIGVAPTFNWSSLAIDPFSAASPNPDGSYSGASHADAAWGLGFQAGLFYQPLGRPWSIGASYKSTQWFETYEMNGVDHVGAPRVLTMDMDYPSIISLGFGYVGLPRMAIACDVRYIDYANTQGFKTSGFDSTGAVTGFGWDSIWVFSNGIQFDLHPRCKWRVGYTYNTSPIDSSTIFYNTPAPAIVQHHLSTGFTFDLGQGWNCTLSYHHGFKNTVSGPWQHPLAGSMAGTEVRHSLYTHSLSFGIAKTF